MTGAEKQKTVDAAKARTKAAPTNEAAPKKRRKGGCCSPSRAMEEAGSGARQGSCRLSHAANAGLFVDFGTMPTTESFSGFSVTAPMGVQLRVWRDQRAGLRARAWRYTA